MDVVTMWLWTRRIATVAVLMVAATGIIAGGIWGAWHVVSLLGATRTMFVLALLGWGLSALLIIANAAKRDTEADLATRVMLLEEDLERERETVRKLRALVPWPGERARRARVELS